MSYRTTRKYSVSGEGGHGSSSSSNNSDNRKKNTDFLADRLGQRRTFHQVTGDDGDASDEGKDDITSDSDRETQTGRRFAQYIDSEDEVDSDQDTDSDEKSSDGSASIVYSEHGRSAQDRHDAGNQETETALREKLAHVPFSALVKARRSVARSTSSPPGSDEDEDEEPDEFEQDRQSERKNAERKALRAIEKRESKHAPTEMSSRRPVSRRRTVIEPPLEAAGQEQRRRDPRFSSLSASLPNKGLFQASYGFLRSQQTDEVQMLRKTLAKIKRQEAHHAGPRARSEAALLIRTERERVELALRREEGRENERRRREHEGEVVRRAKKAIEERVKEGGKRFFLKDAEKKKLVLQDKFARLGGSSGNGDGGNGDSDRVMSSASRGGLQRAVERRRKKNASKDRRIPLGGGGGIINDGHTFHDSAPLPKRKKLQATATTTIPPKQRRDTRDRV